MSLYHINIIGGTELLPVVFEVVVTLSEVAYSGIVMSVSSLFPKGRPVLCSTKQASRIAATATCRMVLFAILPNRGIGWYCSYAQ